MIGDRSRFPAKVQEYLAQAERETAGGERLTLILALNYSSRSDWMRAVRLLAGRSRQGNCRPKRSTNRPSAARSTRPPIPIPIW